MRGWAHLLGILVLPMYVAELIFRRLRAPLSPADAASTIDGLIGLLMKNGQVLGDGSAVAQIPAGFSSTVTLPERTSLLPRFNNRYVTEALAGLGSQGLRAPRTRIVGRAPSGAVADRCARPSWRVLFTTFLCIDSPVRCGDCFAPVPLYRLPEREPFRREALRFWAHAWQACDRLQMGCRVGERFGTDQISSPTSDLGRWGRELCARVRRLTKIPTYLYLYRGGAKSRSREERRRCPLCDGPWRLKEPLHQMFDFKCNRCRLVSNIGWDVR